MSKSQKRQKTSEKSLAKRLADHFKTTVNGLESELRRRGWESLDDFVEDVGMPESSYTYPAAKQPYGPKIKGNTEWKEVTKVSSYHRTFLGKLGASYDESVEESPLRSLWVGMLRRCYDPKSRSYAAYSKRGVSESWLVFENFERDMGDRPPGKSLDRIDNSKGYSKENCKWSTPKEQSNNTCKTVKLDYEGRTYGLQELADRLGLKYATLAFRVKRWPKEQWANPSEEFLEEVKKAGVAKMVAARCAKRGLTTIDGVSKTLKDWVRHYGLSEKDYNNVKRLTRNGADVKLLLEKLASRGQ